MRILKRQFDTSLNFVSLFPVIKKTLSTFLAQTMYTLLKRSSLKWKCLRLSSTQVKIHQITHANFETTSQFLFKFCIILHCQTHNSSVNFKLILFLLSYQSSNFETFKCSGETLPYSSCHFSNHKSFFLQSLHHPSESWKRNKWKCKFWCRLSSADFRVFGSNFTKFLSFLKSQIRFCSSFASIFKAMRHNSSVLVS